MNELSVCSSTSGEIADVHNPHSAALYRAYMRGAYDAMRRQAEEASSIKMALAAMGFGFLCWIGMMFFVFK